MKTRYSQSWSAIRQKLEQKKWDEGAWIIGLLCLAYFLGTVTGVVLSSI